MIIVWPLVALAALLLWFPLIARAQDLRPALDADDYDVPEFPRLALSWVNWLDLARALAGTWVLRHKAIIFGPTAGADMAQGLMLLAGVLAVGVVCQAIRFYTPPLAAARRVIPIAPVFFLSGITVILPGPAVGGFAVGASWALGCGARKAQVVLPVMALALGLGGFLLVAPRPALVMNLALIFAPMALTIPFVCRQRYVGRFRKPN